MVTGNIDFSAATSTQIESSICEQVVKIRLSRNITQADLANEAGVSLRTIGRLEKGEGVSLDTFIRVLIALKIQQNLETLLPDTSVRPMERIASRGSERKRARPKASKDGSSTWKWDE